MNSNRLSTVILALTLFTGLVHAQKVPYLQRQSVAGCRVSSVQADRQATAGFS